MLESGLSGYGHIVVLVEVVVVVAVEVLALVVQICPDEPLKIPSLCAVEVIHLPQRVCVNDDAPKNMAFMLNTLDTSHLEISRLNDDAC